MGERGSSLMYADPVIGIVVAIIVGMALLPLVLHFIWGVIGFFSLRSFLGKRGRNGASLDN